MNSQITQSCLVEEVEFEGGRDHCGGSMPEKLFAVEGAAVIATGALSCTRAVYNAAVRMNKLNQFFHCAITKEEYTLGSYGEKLLACINKAVNSENVKFVVIYSSCLEILTQMDFDSIIENAHNPLKIPVKVLIRGPLVKRYCRPGQELKKILSQIEPGNKPLVQKQMTLPPLYPDFNGASAVLQYWDTYNFLVNAGGCTNCIIELGNEKEKYRLKSSRLDDVQISLGCDTLIKNGIEQDFKTQGKDLACILGSTTLTFTGLDTDKISQSLEECGISNVYINTNGFAPGPVGASAAALALGRKLLHRTKKNLRCINILGYTPMLFGSTELIRPGIKQMEKYGYKCSLWGAGGIQNAENAAEAALNWVISAEGLELAGFMDTEFGIPYVCGIPVGKYAEYSWCNKINKIMTGSENEKIEIPAKTMPRANQPKIVIIGEPMLNSSIGKSLYYDFGFTNTKQYVYAPGSELKKLYNRVIESKNFDYISETTELEAAVGGADVIIADPAYRDYIQDYNAAFVPMPYPLISGKRFLNRKYEIFGEQGGIYLLNALKDFI